MAFLTPVTLPSCRNVRYERAEHAYTGFSSNPRKDWMHPVSMANQSSSAHGGFRLLERPHFFPLLVQTAQSVWHRIWDTMMAELAPSDDKGSYSRPKSTFTGRLRQLENKSEAALTLYVGMECPWCHRVLLMRQLLGMTNLELKWCRAGKGGLWELEEESVINGKLMRTVRDVYLELENGFRGRATVPMLVESGKILCNESAEMLKEIPVVLGLDSGFELGNGVWICLRPKPSNRWGVDVARLDLLCQDIYEMVNNGVYKCGFARNQEAYNKAVSALFKTLDSIEADLTKSRFLMSNQVITEADLRLFPTVYRFDTVYATLFKANLKYVSRDYPAISSWARDMYSLPGVRDTGDLRTTKESYFSRLFPLNPGGIIPAGPTVDFNLSHDRAAMTNPVRASAKV